MNSFDKTAVTRKTNSPAFKGDTFNQRREASGAAREAMLARFRAKPDASDPAIREQQAAQIALSAARDARQAERKELKEAEAARLAAEAAEQAATQAARAAEEIARAETLKVDQKAARDARYAARQARRRA
jgi:FtsZ-interacting cell division protein ZipA